ncbi:MAG: DNA gyrase inhibitor YacG [Rhizobiales bacterium]|nr:DNA gyrase inhibitor YacG [Hyphomicrobiales bacterium]MBA67531.1 DNA gyrase inhibitor YacG [Hyphomicrobiales bacterium]|tara:strand:- start:218 stop:421 length:204 start_codon:yes stop_codon:yes gene_type:complete
MVADPKVTPLRKPQPCPECGKPSTRDSYPFCSERCRSIDLNRWFSGSYAIPVSESGENTEEEPDDRG